MNKVKLIGITKPVGFAVTGEIQTAEDLIAYCARVSNPENQYNTVTASKLLQYCARNNHWSIFEMVNVIMEIQTTRDIGRQILRHRSFSFQEFSQRYAAVAEMSEPREARWQDPKNRQNSIEPDLNNTINQNIITDWEWRQEAMLEAALQSYHWAIEHGIAKEQARVVLPEGLTMSRMYMSGSLRSWLHYIQIRTEKGTQKEHRLIAEECKKIILEQFPSLRGCFDGD